MDKLLKNMSKIFIIFQVIWYIYVLWIIPSLIISGVKHITYECHKKTYGVELIWSGNLFCTKDKEEDI